MGEEGENNEFYSENETMVYWNMDDYPIAADGIDDDLGFIRNNIEHVLHRMGFHGPKEINVYCKRINSDVEEKLSKAGIFYLPSCTRTYMDAVNKVAPPPPLDMTVFMIQSAATFIGPYGPVDLVVIAKPIGELDRVLDCLKSRGHNILVIDPTGFAASFSSVESLLGSAYLLRAQAKKDPSEDDPSEFEEYLSDKIVDFTEPIGPVKGNRTAVFLDAEDCPFPQFSSPDEIYDKIESSLLERGFLGKLSVWAYLDDEKKGSWRDAFLGRNKDWASRIYFLPGGNKASRRIRMANDITFWARDFPSVRGSLILFSDQFLDDAEYTGMLQNYVSANYYILLVIPTQDSNKPESPEWPGLLIDGGGYRLGSYSRRD